MACREIPVPEIISTLIQLTMRHENSHYIELYGPFGLAGLSIHRFMALAVNNQLKSKIYGTQNDTLDATHYLDSIHPTHLRYLASGILLKGEIIVACSTAAAATPDAQVARAGTSTHGGVRDNADLTLRLAVDDMAAAASFVAAISVGQHMARRLRVGLRVVLQLRLGGHRGSAYIRYGEVRHTDALLTGAGLSVGRHCRALLSKIKPITLF